MNPWTWIKAKLPQRIHRTPNILQMEAVECGAASLGMVMGYFGCQVPLEELRYQCGVSRDGTSAGNIIKAGKHYGFVGKGFRMEPKALRDSPLPAIVFWNFNHFVVVEGFRRNKVHINDPALGRRAVSDIEFDDSFSGVVLILQPGENFSPQGKPQASLANTLRRLWPARAKLWFLCVLTLVASIPNLITPAFSQIFADYFLVLGMTSWLKPLIWTMLGVGVTAAGLIAYQQYDLMQLRNRLGCSWAACFVLHLLKLPIPFFQQRSPAEISARIRLNDELAGLLAGSLSTVGFNLFTIILFGFFLYAYDPLLTVIGVLFSLINLAAFILIASRLKEESHRLTKESSQLMGSCISGFRIIETLKASAMEEPFFAKVSGLHAKLMGAEQHSERLRILLNMLPVGCGMLSSISVMVIGGDRVMDGAMSIGMLVAFQGLLTQFQMPITELVGAHAQLQSAEGMVARLDDTLHYQEDPEFQRPGIPPVPKTQTRNQDIPIAKLQAKLHGQLSIRDLTYGHNPLAAPLLKGLSLEASPGAKIALVGGSGSGKSTLGQILAGLLNPWEGEIILGGVSLFAAPREQLRNSIAFVDQTITLFEGSVADNVSLWDADIDEERIMAACRDAEIHDDIIARPGGYAFQVMDGGRNLSGGQRQRLEIARALVKNPSLLILDEATNALDTLTEYRIFANLRRHGCTSVVIAHRLSTIRDADEILVLMKGAVVQRGTHETLVAIPGVYRDLIES